MFFSVLIRYLTIHRHRLGHVLGEKPGILSTRLHEFIWKDVQDHTLKHGFLCHNVQYFVKALSISLVYMNIVATSSNSVASCNHQAVPFAILFHVI